MNFRPLSEKEERIASAIVDAAFKVHKALGPGLLESVYESCFCYELTKHGMSYQRQLQRPAKYDELEFNSAFRQDVVVEGLIVCELKAIERLLPLHTAQLLTYLKLSGKRLGFLINFNVPLIRNGIKRTIL